MSPEEAGSPPSSGLHGTCAQAPNAGALHPHCLTDQEPEVDEEAEEEETPLPEGRGCGGEEYAAPVAEIESCDEVSGSGVSGNPAREAGLEGGATLRAGLTGKVVDREVTNVETERASTCFPEGSATRTHVAVGWHRNERGHLVNRPWRLGDPVPESASLEELIRTFPRPTPRYDREALMRQWTAEMTYPHSPTTAAEVLAGCRRYRAYIEASSLRRSRMGLVVWLTEEMWRRAWDPKDVWIEDEPDLEEREATHFRLNYNRGLIVSGRWYHDPALVPAKPIAHERAQATSPRAGDLPSDLVARA